MADNSERTPGVGELIASDDIGGVKHPRVKVSLGPDGTAVDLKGVNNADGGDGSGVMAVSPVFYDGAVVRQWRAVSTIGFGGSPAMIPASGPMLYNGATGDWERGNTEGTLLASAARTADAASPNQVNYNGRGVIVGIDITVAGTGTISFQVTGIIGSPTNNWVDLKGSIVASGAGEYNIIVYPGCTETDTSAVTYSSAPLPRTWFLYADKSDASSWTFSADCAVIV